MSAGDRRQSDEPEDLREESPVENASSSISKVKIALWTGVVCANLAMGIGAGLMFQSTGDPLNSSAVSRQSEVVNTPLPDLTVAQTLDAAQRALRVENNPQLALRLYRRAISEMTRPPVHIVFEEAICYELLGQFRKAWEIYHRLSELNDRGAESRLQIGVELGLARTLLALGDDGAAAGILYELSVDPRLATEPWAAAEAAYSLSRALTERLLRTPEDLLLRDSTMAPPIYKMSGPHLLQAVNQVGGAAPPAPMEPGATGQALFGPAGQLDSVYPTPQPVVPATFQTGPSIARPALGVKVLYKVSHHPEEIQLSIRVASMPALPLVESLLDSAGLQPVWSQSARTAMLGRTVAVESPNMSLASVLDAVLTGYGVSWQGASKDAVVRFRLLAELEKRDQMALNHAAAVRSTRRAVSEFPDHPDIPTALLTIGNLHALEREFAAANAQFEMLLRRHGQSDIAARAWFNLGKTHLLAGQAEAAQGAFYRVVDGLRGGELRAIAALFVGRLHLEQEQLTQAKRALGRARTMSQNSLVRASAGLLLSACYLRTGNPHAANMTLMENREDIAMHRKEAGALLGAMARFQTAGTDDARNIHGRALVTSLSHVEPQQFFGKYGAVIVGEAYAELGLYQEMAVKYELALSSGIGGATAQRMKLALARVHQSRGQADSARTIFQQLNASESPDETTDLKLTQIESRISEAEFEFGERRSERCLGICYELLRHNLSEQQQAHVLMLMGKTFRRLEDHNRAALCFSGLIPEPQEATP